MITYLDSGVLLSAWKSGTLRGAALAVLADGAREFVTSHLVKLELLPKPEFEKLPRETAFYESFFADARAALPLDKPLGEEALALAGKYGLAGMDALHIAAALRLKVAEFYTSEKPGKPMFRVKEIKIISLHDLTG